MNEYEFFDDTAELSIAGEIFTLPLTEITLSTMQKKTERLLAAALAAGGSEETVTDAIIETIDGILGEGSCGRITASSRKLGMLDALGIFTFICEEFTAAWRERLISISCRSM